MYTYTHIYILRPSRAAAAPGRSADCYHYHYITYNILTIVICCYCYYHYYITYMTKNIHLLRLRICLTQTPNKRIRQSMRYNK